MDIWQEIEAKVNSEDEVPVVKTSNKVSEISKSHERQSVYFFFFELMRTFIF